MCNTIIIVITFNCTESFLQIQLNKQRLFNTTSMFLFIFERKVNVFVYIWTRKYFCLYLNKSQCFCLYLNAKSMFLFIFEQNVNVFVYI